MSNPLTRLDDANLSLLDAKHNKKKKKWKETLKKNPILVFYPQNMLQSHTNRNIQ